MNNPVMHVNSDGDSAILTVIITGAILGGIIGFGTTLYSDYMDDGQIFNECVHIDDYLDSIFKGIIFGVRYGVGALVSLIPVVGPFIAPFAAAGATWLIDWTNKEYGWLDDVKQWFYNL